MLYSLLASYMFYCVLFYFMRAISSLISVDVIYYSFEIVFFSLQIHYLEFLHSFHLFPNFSLMDSQHGSWLSNLIFESVAENLIGILCTGVIAVRSRLHFWFTGLAADFFGGQDNTLLSVLEVIFLLQVTYSREKFLLFFWVYKPPGT